ncbi:MAG: 4-(cytidine 5'-diphospho)-2-C-methyl-D-erythritol kinase [Desulfobulbus sp.]|nr:MAG: 4-(cytidine 5'-diphospho)-2-C-methyl-D-erythritol kinase [Desulfobulbus sp.]
MAEQYRLLAPAKINLYLRIIGRRPDGYHELRTLMQKLALFDILTFTLLPDKGVRLNCRQNGLPEDEKNIVYQAARLFFEHTGKKGQGIEITLEKNIPVAAGLGGGSSDAAAALLALNHLFETGCTVDELAALGVRLGADVPLFIYDFPAAWATGIGEQLTPAIPLTAYVIVLANPGISVSTKWAYDTFALTSEKNIFNLYSSQKENQDSSADVPFVVRPFSPEELANDLERVTSEKFSVINMIKEEMVAGGAAGTLMSGSGPTVFGLFPKENPEQAKACCRKLMHEYDQVYLVNPLT